MHIINSKYNTNIKCREYQTPIHSTNCTLILKKIFFDFIFFFWIYPLNYDEMCLRMINRSISLKSTSICVILRYHVNVEHVFCNTKSKCAQFRFLHFWIQHSFFNWSFSFHKFESTTFMLFRFDCFALGSTLIDVYSY